MNNDIYKLLPTEDCYSKTHGSDFFETYNSHINLCLAFLNPVLKALNYHNSIDDVKRMVQLHDIGKLGPEFQEAIKMNKPQYIRHEELAFIKWLDNYSNLKDLKLPYILAILAHHKTLIDDESAILIEQFISNHPNWKKLSKEWLSIIKRQRPERIDHEFLSALPLIDILRTVDILASFTSETVYLQYMKKPEIKKSLYEAAFSDISKELSCINIRTDEIKYETISDDGKTVKIDLNSPVNSIIEYVRREKS
ncbi:MAG: CRISPR-associated endonuclease Cas3'' [Candidatus Methanoperedens sp.]|nr:CRISPR-associated endonuclease Cas3'' [Candidatus Methanoperedens sp.]